MNLPTNPSNEVKPTSGWASPMPAAETARALARLILS